GHRRRLARLAGADSLGADAGAADHEPAPVPAAQFPHLQRAVAGGRRGAVRHDAVHPATAAGGTRLYGHDRGPGADRRRRRDHHRHADRRGADQSRRRTLPDRLRVSHAGVGLLGHESFLHRHSVLQRSLRARDPGGRPAVPVHPGEHRGLCGTASGGKQSGLRAHERGAQYRRLDRHRHRADHAVARPAGASVATGVRAEPAEPQLRACPLAPDADAHGACGRGNGAGGEWTGSGHDLSRGDAAGGHALVHRGVSFSDDRRDLRDAAHLPDASRPARRRWWWWGGGAMRLTSVAALLALGTLSACTVGPSYHRPQVAVPAAYSAAPALQTLQGLPMGAGPDHWWQQFHDPQLNSLMTRALSGNLNLQAAASRIRAARDQLILAGAARLPSVDASASANETHLSQNSGISEFAKLLGGGDSGGKGGAGASNGFGVPGTSFTTFSLGFDASWEIDTFGGVRRSIQAAQARAEQTLWSLRDSEVSVSAEV